LIPDPPSFSLTQINLRYISQQKNCLLNQTLSKNLITALQIIRESEGSASGTNMKDRVFIHCLDGRWVTGLLVLLYRHINKWSQVSSLEEFWTFQTVLKAPITAHDIDKINKEIVVFISDTVDMLKDFEPRISR
jgi:protein tyrosine/serine phosphatase